MSTDISLKTCIESKTMTHFYIIWFKHCYESKTMWESCWQPFLWYNWQTKRTEHGAKSYQARHFSLCFTRPRTFCEESPPSVVMVQHIKRHQKDRVSCLIEGLPVKAVSKGLAPRLEAGGLLDRPQVPLGAAYAAGGRGPDKVHRHTHTHTHTQIDTHMHTH